jgi:predicted Zn-dependent protease
MSLPMVSRRRFVAAGSALLASTSVPAWAEIFPQERSLDDRRAEAADAALARASALGASYADIRINRYRRESIATRERQVQNVSRSTSYGLGFRVLVNGAWGFAATNRVEPAAARAAADHAVAIARANARLAAGKVVLADAGKVVTTWTSAFKRDPFEVPLETKTAFLMKLNESALAVPGVTFVSSQILFVEEQKFFGSSDGSRITQRLVRTYPQFTVTATDRASGDFQTRPVVDRAQLVGYEYVDDYPWFADAEKAGHEAVEKLKATPVSPGRYDIVVDPSQLFLAIHESVGHSTELDRALGWEANMAGTSFLKAADAGTRSSEGSFSLTARSGDGTGSGYFARDHFDLARLNVQQIAAEAVGKAVRSQQPKAIEPGAYPVILEPQAVADLLGFLTDSFDARTADEGRSAFSAKDGKTRVGEALFSERVNLYSDPAHDSLPAVPATDEGVPASRLSLIKGGVLENLQYSRFWAQERKRLPTPGPVNYIMESTQPPVALDDMIKGMKRGLLISRFWYVRLVDPRTIVLTGLTRDGLWWIENGQIRHPVRNLRFNQSVLAMLAPWNVGTIGASQRLSPFMVPPLELKAFTFTSISDAI